MSKRACEPEPAAGTTMVGSGFLQFRLEFEKARPLRKGQGLYSDVSACGHSWRIVCCPRGHSDTDGEYLDVYLRYLGKSEYVKAFYEIFLIDKDGEPCPTAAMRSQVTLFTRCQRKCGYIQLVKWADLENKYLTEGHFTFVYAIVVIRDRPIAVPPSDIGKHLGTLLDSKDGTDVSFTIEGEEFHAHRAVLAARWPVFRAELFGSMAEVTMSSIKLRDISPATFRVMLRFIYTDSLPEDNELGDRPTEMFMYLLAAANRYALDRLKLMCAQKLCDSLSVDTATATLDCAETYSCLELKNKCYDFFCVVENFKVIAVRDGYYDLGKKFPHILGELRNWYFGNKKKRLLHMSM